VIPDGRMRLASQPGAVGVLSRSRSGTNADIESQNSCLALAVVDFVRPIVSIGGVTCSLLATRC
jgi:hypothetical protein